MNLEANKLAAKCPLEKSTSGVAMAQPGLWDPQLSNCLAPEAVRVKIEMPMMRLKGT